MSLYQCNNWKNDGLFRWVSLMNLSNSWLIFWLNRNCKDGVNECHKSDDSVLNLLFEYSTRWKWNLYTNKRARRESITGETHPNILLHHNSVRHTEIQQRLKLLPFRLFSFVSFAFHRYVCPSPTVSAAQVNPLIFFFGSLAEFTFILMEYLSHSHRPATPATPLLRLLFFFCLFSRFLIWRDKDFIWDGKPVAALSSLLFGVGRNAKTTPHYTPGVFFSISPEHFFVRGFIKCPPLSIQMCDSGFPPQIFCPRDLLLHRIKVMMMSCI